MISERAITECRRNFALIMQRRLLSGLNELRDQARAALTEPRHELLFGDDTQR